MGRTEEIVNECKDISMQRFRKSKKDILGEYRDNRKEISDSVLKVVKPLFIETFGQQENGRKGTVHIIGFFYLSSSLLTGSHKYMISLYDETFYLDKGETSTVYVPDFIVPHYQADIEYLTDRIRENYSGLKNYEMERVQFLHIKHYYGLMKDIFTDILPDIKNLPEYAALEKIETPRFLFGGYWDYAEIMEEKSAVFSN